jgi:hypothetical protein
MLFLCGLDFLNLFAIPYKPEGFFAKSPNSWLRGTLWCEQRLVDFKKRDVVSKAAALKSEPDHFCLHSSLSGASDLAMYPQL